MNSVLIAILVAIPVFLGLKTAVRWVVFRDRKVERLDDLFQLFRFTQPLDFGTFSRILTLIGEAYHVRPGKLRPDDSFEGRLGKLDTWNLGEGAEELQARLKKEISICLTPEAKLRTVQDLLDYCAGARKEHSE